SFVCIDRPPAPPFEEVSGSITRFTVPVSGSLRTSVRGSCNDPCGMYGSPFSARTLLIARMARWDGQRKHDSILHAQEWRMARRLCYTVMTGIHLSVRPRASSVKQCHLTARVQEQQFGIRRELLASNEVYQR